MEFNKPLPSNPEAEKTILGAILLDTTLIYSVAKQLKADDFYNAMHVRVYKAMLKLLARKEKIDTVLLATELRKDGQLENIGGMASIVNLSHGLPHFSTVDAYIKLVKDDAIIRQTAKLCQLTLNECLAQVESPTDILAKHEKDLLSIRKVTNFGETKSTLATLVQKSADRFMSVRKGEANPNGMTTGFKSWDALTGGLQKTDLIIIGARPSMGKAQPLTSLVFSAEGWKEIGSLKVGDKIFNSEGGLSQVLEVIPQGLRDTYEVSFSDKSKVECCDEHLWEVSTRNGRKYKKYRRQVLQLKEMIPNIIINGNRKNYGVRKIKPLLFTKQELPIHPYLLGVLLGDGCFRKGNVEICNPNLHIIEYVQNVLPVSDTLSRSKDITYRVKRKTRSNHPSDTKAIIRQLGLEGLKSCDKFIPYAYLNSSLLDRIAILQGLMDTDGHYSKGNGLAEFCTSSSKMADHIKYLVGSLGGTVSHKTYPSHYRDKEGNKVVCLLKHRVWISFTSDINPFLNTEHRNNFKPRKLKENLIESVRFLGQKESVCIRTSAKDALYITNDFILTHNSSLAYDIARNVCKEDKERVVVIFSPEMSKEQITNRMICSEGLIDGSAFRNALLTGGEMVALKQSLDTLAGYKIIIEDRPSPTMFDVEAVLRDVEQEYKRIDLIIGDHAGKFKTVRNNNRSEDLGEISGGFKDFAKMFDATSILLSQLSRKCEARNPPKPIMSDLYESGRIEQDADGVALIYRDEYYHPTTAEQGVAEINYVKNRNNPTGSFKLTFKKSSATFRGYQGF